MEKERVQLFPDELPSGKRFKIKRRSKERRRALVSLFCCVVIFALGFALSDAIRNGTIKLPSFLNVQHVRPSSTTSTTAEPSDDPPETLAPSIEELYEFDYSLIEAGEIAVIPLDLSVSEYGDTYIYNDTAYNPDLEGLLEKNSFLPAFSESDEPLVLIIHTHTTESYTEEGKLSYSENEEYARSQNEEENVVAVGKVIADILNENGIKTLHSTVFHDLESYRDSYARSAETVKYYLEKYPSIKYVFDIHRDSIIRSTGEIVRPVTIAEDEVTAQIMCVVGTDQVMEREYGWENNLALALAIRSSMNEKYGNMVRGTCLRESSYNQELAPVSLLFEIGAGGNYLSEAKTAAKLLAEELADIIKNSN